MTIAVCHNITDEKKIKRRHRELHQHYAPYKTKINGEKNHTDWQRINIDCHKNIAVRYTLASKNRKFIQITNNLYIDKKKILAVQHRPASKINNEDQRIYTY